jgi:hypothetical protein
VSTALKPDTLFEVPLTAIRWWALSKSSTLTCRQIPILELLAFDIHSAHKTYEPVICFNAESLHRQMRLPIDQKTRPAIAEAAPRIMTRIKPKYIRRYFQEGWPILLQVSLEPTIVQWFSASRDATLDPGRR